MAFTDMLDITITSSEDDFVEAIMPITHALYQPYGFLHGGATLALLETVASVGAENRTNFEYERPFGVDVHVRHVKSGKSGLLHGCARLNRIEGTKQFWDVVATDSQGDVVSEGVVITKIVSLERLAQKEQERASAKSNA